MALKERSLCTLTLLTVSMMAIFATTHCVSEATTATVEKPTSSCGHLEVVQQEEGQRVQLHCISKNEIAAPNLTWSHKIGGDYEPVEPEKRMTRKTMMIDQSSTLHILQINRVTQEDGGSYRCATQDGQVLQDVLLQIYKLPVIFDNSTDREEMMWEEDADLYCWASGYPGLSVVWTRAQDQPFTAGEQSYTGQHLKVVKARQEFGGEYLCTARITGFRNASVSREVTLIVEGPPHTYGFPNDFAASLGDNVSIPCAVVGNPEPAVKWTRTGKVMGADITRYLVTEVPINEMYKNSTLTVFGVTEDDYETYTCEAENEYGKSPVNYTITKMTV